MLMRLGDLSGFTHAVMHRPSISVPHARRPFLLLLNIYYFIILHLFFLSDVYLYIIIIVSFLPSNVSCRTPSTKYAR